MRLITLILILTLIDNSYGQTGQLIPVDSSNYIIVRDSLIDEYQFFSDTNMKYVFEPQKLKSCPCSIESTMGLISFKSKSNRIKNNTCFYVYQVDNNYFVQVGKKTKRRDNQGKYKWIFKIKSIKPDFAEEIIKDFRIEISNSEIPKYNSWNNYSIVADGIIYTFGDIKSQSFGITSHLDFSESVNRIIKISEKLVRKNIR